ncbi:RND family efflux transporter MFP subunit [Alishewanella aestuarii B11]|uniref:RND family efflux transporter MFP subunit n=1 Tax=Alishewanella aestuarii B11 TaxID=1197174 RepID=J1Q4I7_9ALTE|nr:efflux RND transporter periplasmic adaptor subunit [Alishewanella aestuarii]EJI86038.1 RND family efflux transporter MFP subunit [Alishewanella aestuarii B11]
MLKRMIIMLVLVTVLFGGIFGFKAVGNYFMNQFFDNMPMPPAAITAATVSRDAWQPAVNAIGSFAAVNSTELTTEASGIIRSIRFENGALIKKGELLVQLDDSVDQAELARLKAAEQLAKLEQSRLERLFRDKGVSELDLRRRESEAAQASAAVASQQARIAQKSLYAPFDGVAGIRQVSLGQLLTGGTPVVSLQSLDPIYLNFTLPEQQLALIEVGKPLTVRVDAYAEQAFVGEITAVAPGIRESSRSIEVQATFANPEQLLRPGMFARVSMTTGEPNTVTLIPQTAVQFNPYGNSVFVITEQDGQQVAQQRFIRTGEARGDLIAVTAGLEPGEQVATSGLLKLRNGAVVNIVENSSAAPSAELNPTPANQ